MMVAGEILSNPSRQVYLWSFLKIYLLSLPRGLILCSNGGVFGEIHQHGLWVEMGATERVIGRSAVPDLSLGFTVVKHPV